MSKRTLGILATMAGSAIGAWWWTTQRGSSVTVRRVSARDRGTVIFDNHTTASEIAEDIV